MSKKEIEERFEIVEKATVKIIRDMCEAAVKEDAKGSLKGKITLPRVFELVSKSLRVPTIAVQATVESAKTKKEIEKINRISKEDQEKL